MKKYLLIVTASIICFSCKKEVQPAGGSNGDTATIIKFAPPSTTASADFKGVNWADERDNFTDDNLILSGTTAQDDYATIQAKAEVILTGFKNSGANTVRLPVNPATVSGSWWKQYKGAIDKASELQMKVILAYWEGASSKDGMVDNSYAFWNMWDSVTTQYSQKSNIYFEVFNEPHGYSLPDLTSLYAHFLSEYPNLPGGRIILDGAGYATDVNGIGGDSRFDSCLLSFHYYTWFDNSKQTTADWEQTINTLSFPSRTIVTEFGVPMTIDKDYIAAPANDREVTYLQGMTNAIHDAAIGCVYWPGLRTNDSYSMFIQSGSGIAAPNASGLSRLRYAWKEENVNQPYALLTSGAYYKVINKSSNKALDVINSSVDDGATIVQWEYWSGDNQQWQFNTMGDGFFSIINKNSDKALDVDSASTIAGKNIIQHGYNSAESQQWQIIDMGFGSYKIINQKSGFALDVNGASTNNGAGIIQWYYNSGNNQIWQIATP